MQCIQQCRCFCLIHTVDLKKAESSGTAACMHRSLASPWKANLRNHRGALLAVLWWYRYSTRMEVSTDRVAIPMIAVIKTPVVEHFSNWPPVMWLAKAPSDKIPYSLLIMAFITFFPNKSKFWKCRIVAFPKKVIQNLLKSILTVPVLYVWCVLTKQGCKVGCLGSVVSHHELEHRERQQHRDPQGDFLSALRGQPEHHDGDDDAEQTRRDDIDEIVKRFTVKIQGEDDSWKEFARVCVFFEGVAGNLSSLQVPFTIRHKVLLMNFRRSISEVHEIFGVCPVIYYDVTLLYVKWIVRHVQCARCSKISSKRPQHSTSVFDLHTEISGKSLMVESISTKTRSISNLSVS